VFTVIGGGEKSRRKKADNHNDHNVTDIPPLPLMNTVYMVSHKGKNSETPMQIRPPHSCHNLFGHLPSTLHAHQHPAITMSAGQTIQSSFVRVSMVHMEHNEFVPYVTIAPSAALYILKTVATIKKVVLCGSDPATDAAFAQDVIRNILTVSVLNCVDTKFTSQMVGMIITAASKRTERFKVVFQGFEVCDQTHYYAAHLMANAPHIDIHLPQRIPQPTAVPMSYTVYNSVYNATRDRRSIIYESHYKKCDTFHFDESYGKRFVPQETPTAPQAILPPVVTVFIDGNTHTYVRVDNDSNNNNPDDDNNP
jgi:hypothetical protein